MSIKDKFFFIRLQIIILYLFIFNIKLFANNLLQISDNNIIVNQEKNSKKNKQLDKQLANRQLINRQLAKQSKSLYDHFSNTQELDKKELDKQELDKQELDKNIVKKKEFLYLKASQVIMRAGPGKNYKSIWLYKAEYEPVQVLEKYEHWVKVQDIEKNIGWIHKNLLSKNKHIIIIKKANIRRWLDDKIIAIVYPFNKCKVLKIYENKLKVKCNNITGFINIKKTWEFNLYYYFLYK
ncbi:MAG: SH3 domain-containing protein [Rickettsiales bacterium]